MRRISQMTALAAAAVLLSGCSMASLWPFGSKSDTEETVVSGVEPATTATNAAPVYEVQVPASGIAGDAQHVGDGSAAASTPQPYAPVNATAHPVDAAQPVVTTQPLPGQVQPMNVTPTPVAATAEVALLPGRFYVRAGAFAQAANADRAEAALRGAGLPVHRHIITGRKGTLTGLRIGPYSTPQQAREAQRTVRGLPLKLDTNIFQHRP